MKMTSNVKQTKTYTFLEGRILLFQDLAVLVLITLPIKEYGMVSMVTLVFEENV